MNIGMQTNFSEVILHPFQAKTCTGKGISLVVSLVVGVISLGFLHLYCHYSHQRKIKAVAIGTKPGGVEQQSSVKIIAKKVEIYGLCRLARFYVDRDLTKSLNYLLRAHQAGYQHAAMECYRLAKKFYREGHNDAAFCFMKASVEMGFRAAYKELGEYYKEGIGTRKDEDKALECLLKAYEYEISKNSPQESINDLISQLEKEKKFDQAFRLAKKSADAGVFDACGTLGRFYEEGIGTSKNSDLAKHYYHLSMHAPPTQSSSSIIIFAFHRLKLLDPDWNFENLLEIYKNTKDEVDKETAEEKKRRIKENREVRKEIYSLIKNMENGKNGYQQEEERAFRYALASADAGFNDLYDLLGRYYEKGIGVEKDGGMAREYYRMEIRRLELLQLNFEEDLQTKFEIFSLICERAGCKFHALATNDPIIEIDTVLNSPIYKHTAKKIWEELDGVAKMQGKSMGTLTSDILDLSEEARIGVCEGMVMSFIFNLFASRESDLLKRLQEVTQNYMETPTEEVIALQKIYLFLNNEFPDVDADTISDKIYSLKGFKVEVLDHLKSSDDETCLGLWAKESDGYFRTSFATGENEFHAVLLIKEQGRIFLFDPNFGLAECPDEESLGKIIKINYDEVDNHKIVISRIVKES